MLNTGRTEQISIHALREEGDPIPTPRRGESNQFLSTPSARRATPPGQVQQIRHVDFYPRPPRGGRRVGPQYQCRCNRLFLSTPSARRATRHRRATGRETTDFYPRPPRGGRRKRKDWSTRMELISIHALREEGDSKTLPKHRRHWQFLSTPSARRATENMERTRQDRHISIHALREEGDSKASC